MPKLVRAFVLVAAATASASLGVAGVTVGCASSDGSTSPVAPPPGAPTSDGGASDDAGDAASTPADAATSLDAGTRMTKPLFGVYRWGNGGNEAVHGYGGVDLFEKWLGQDVLVAVDFEANDTWDNAMAPGWQMPAWGRWLKAKPGRVLMQQVPLLPGPWDGSGPTAGVDQGPVSLADCASGKYDAHWTRFAINMVSAGVGDAVLRPGHEFNGGWYTWRAAGRETQFIGCFQHFVTAVRAVAGAHFQIAWNPTAGYVQFAADTAYPGDEYVDAVGIDVYDQSWAPSSYPCAGDPAVCRANAWRDLAEGDHGLAFWSRFARDHKKPMMIPEWRTIRRGDGHGGDDDPEFIQRMHDWMFDPMNHVTIAAKFDVKAGDGDSQLSDNNPVDGPTTMPNAAAKLRSLAW